MHKLLENINGWTQSGPMGNVKQFLPALAIAAGAGGLLAGANATRIMNQPIKAQPISPDEIKNYLSRCCRPDARWISTDDWYRPRYDESI